VTVAASGHTLTQALTLAVYLVLARLATPADFGQLAAGSILISVGLLFTEAGMAAALVQRRDRIEEAAATAVISTFAAGALFALLAFAASPLIGQFFDSGKVAAVAAAVSGLLLLRTIPVVPNALLQRRFSFIRRMIVEPAGVVALGITAIIATANGLGVWGLVLGHYAAAVTDVVLSWSLVRWRPQLGLASLEMWRQLIRYGRYVFISTAVDRVNLQIPVALIGRFVGSGPLGQYRYASRMASAPFEAMLAGASYVIFPAFARIADDADRFRAAFVRALGWMATIGIPSGLILLPFGRPLAELVFGSVWIPAGEAAMALCLFPAAGALFSVVAEAFTANGRTELLLRMVFVQLLLGGIAMVAFVPLGLIGVSAGLSLGSVGAAVYALYLAHVVVGVPARSIAHQIGPPLVAAAAMAGVMLPLEAWVVRAAEHGTVPGLLLLTAELATAAFVYVLLLHVLAPGRLREFARDMRMAIPSRTGDRPTTA